MQRLQVVQNRALKVTVGYDWYTQIDNMHSDTQILRPRAYIKVLALKLYASAKFRQNCHIKKLGADCLVNGRRVPKHLYILS